ncbi:MAG: hypothetical protein AMS17_16060, partial [Spirochaetes bacterium DG_61]
QDMHEAFDKRMEELVLRGTESLKQLNMVSDHKTNIQHIENSRPEDLSFLIAATEGFTLEEKQKFLEMTSTRERLEKSIGSLENIIERLRLSQEIKRIFGRKDDYIWHL